LEDNFGTDLERLLKATAIIHWMTEWPINTANNLC